MVKESEDLCKTCQHYWLDFPLPLDHYVSHCDMLYEKFGLCGTIMDEKIPYPCVSCPLNSYSKKS